MPTGSLGIPTLNHQNIISKETENVEKAELKTSLSLIDEVTSLEQIAEARRPTIGVNHLN